MLKRQVSSVVLKRHRSSVELLPHDVVELILERLPVKFLLRFRSVSKKWKSTIESPRFNVRQQNHRRQTRGPDVLFVTPDDDAPSSRIMFGSSIICTVRFPTLSSAICHGSCDGLVCLYCVYTPCIVINPATRWHQSFPLSSLQQLIIIERSAKEDFDLLTPKLGFGKDKFRGTYKPVWLYNSSEYGLDNVTTCEVFDFTTNSWRYVLPACPYRILASQNPVYLDGSLYWFSDCKETKILSLDLHTETFKVISKAPFAHVLNPYSVIMCILDGRLCVSKLNWPTQVIWSFDSSNTWKKMCSIDVTKKTFASYRQSEFALFPIAILENNKLLLHGRAYLQPLVIHDLHTKSYDSLFTPTTAGDCVYYHQSLFSTLSN